MMHNAAIDGEQAEFHDAGQTWLASWHPPALPPPAGRPHGSSAICFTPDGDVVMVSEDGESWSIPGGRPEPGEDWRQTLDREVFEEACAVVQDATLLGYTRAICTAGHEQGLAIVRAHWRATVSLAPWRPRHEMVGRRLVTMDEALRLTLLSHEPTTALRLFQEAKAP
jgi:ADP-ribose pyrophosphatase YjhB (NUDIX family)